MPDSKRFSSAFKALFQLGFSQTALFTIYKLGLVSGYYRQLTPGGKPGDATAPLRFHALFDLPAPADLHAVLGKDGLKQLLSQADEVVAGNVQLFGADPVPLQLTFDKPLQHWTAYEKDASLYNDLYTGIEDIKFIWEPARFGWAFTLGRAWHLSRDERYPAAFWSFVESFLDGNPPYMGPHWVSAQEVSLRLMAFAWCMQVFSGSVHSSPNRQARLAQAIADHAARLPVTLVYARSQNNNHLLSEAAGLFTAGLALPDHPQAERWRRLGWKWLQRGFQTQVDSYGEYAQHSTNYQRLMLQLALWVKILARNHDHFLPRRSTESLSIATHWLLSLLDPISGAVPNLGANDGAYIFPLSICPFADHRPVLQAAARSFMAYQLPQGVWDEMALWLGVPASEKYFKSPRYLGDCLVGKESWGYLRAVKFRNRPSHADQLHFDLWWRGLNITRDAGSYLYNVAPPWDNTLTHTAVHNTVSVDGCEQMRRAGRFLYLDWATAWQRHPIETDERILQRTIAGHGGYRHQGLRHERTVTVFSDGHWEARDDLLQVRGRRKSHVFRLHWLLPDWEWQMEAVAAGFELRLKSPMGWVKLQLASDQPGAELTLARAGVRLLGNAPIAPIDGWISPTYGQKLAGLSCALLVSSPLDVQFNSQFIFPAD